MNYLCKCSECHETFYLDDSHRENSNKFLRCPHCNHRMCISMLGYCPTCHASTGFRTRFYKDISTGVAKWVKSIPDIANLNGKRGKIFKDFISDAKNAFKGYTGDLPMAHVYGYCCKCGKMSIQCPECNAITHIDDIHQGQVFVCSSCGREFVFV